MNRQVIFRSNMFDPTQKVITEVDGSLSYRDIFKSLTYHPVEYAQIIDGDVKISPEDYDLTPKSEQLLIRIYPGGLLSHITDAISGGVDIIQHEVSDIANVDWNNPWDIAQTGMFFLNPVIYSSFIAGKYGTEWLVKQLIDYPQFSSGINPAENPSLKGGSNRARQMGRIPILLGKHLLHPDIAALSCIDISDGNDGKDQFLYMMFCAGYNNLQIDTSTYKVGDSPLNTTYYPDSSIELKQDGSALSLYDTRRIPASVSTEVTVEDGAIIKTTPTNTRGVEIFITFPRGLYKSKDGKKVSYSVQVKIEYRKTGGSTWYTIATPTYTKAVNETLRFKIVKNFDNLTSSGADYCADRQYDIRVTRITADTDASDVIDAVYFDSFQSVTGVFDGESVDLKPVLSEYASKLSLLAFKIKATQNVNGELESFNFVAQSKVPVYSGSGSGVDQWSTVAASSNPAALFLYVIRDENINKKPVPNDNINWSTFEAWYSYCETEEYECNTYIISEVAIEELLNQIVTCGRATWSIVDGKFNIIIDKAQSTICQYFTPRNSWGLSASKSFDDLPIGLNLKFVDAESGYISAERTVYADDPPPADGRIDDVNLFGCTSSDEAWKRGRYLLANLYLRRESFTFSADIEHISCTRWDRIALSHDVISVGLGYARIKDLRVSGSNIVGFEVDDRVVFE
ncbi:hypothetical protein EOM86_07180, partial [Candidatus Nomurabacteria bacterium]|nr:hypothetical protein [Candidatus Nomurabacteria bacterium]